MSAQNNVGYPCSVLQPYVRCFIDVRMGVAGRRVTSLLPAKLEQCFFVTTGQAPVVSGINDAGGGQDMLSPSYLGNIRGAVSSSLLQLQIQGVLSMFVIVFKPAGFYRLFGIPPVHFADAFVPAALSVGNDWEIMAQQIAAASGIHKRQQIAEKFLLGQLRRMPHHRKTALDQVLLSIEAGTLTNVAGMAQQAYLGERQFRRIFAEHTGLSPHTFLRIARSRRALHLKQLAPGRSWRSIAFELDYTDQSHFNREMKSLTGIEHGMEPVSKQFLYVEGTTLRLL